MYMCYDLNIYLTIKKLYNWLFDISVDQSHEVAEDAHSS